MESYIGTKEVKATPMNRQEYNDFRGWKLLEDENGGDEGYLVEYQDGGFANTPAYKGYVSWSPKDVFEKSYKKLGELPFGAAIELLKQGKRVARKGWNGKGMWLELADVTDHYSDSGFKLDPFIYMKTALDTMIPWLASQSDVLSEDWVEVSV